MANEVPTKRIKHDIPLQQQVFDHVIQQLIVIHNSFNEKVKNLETKLDGFVSSVRDIVSENLTTSKSSHCCVDVLQKLTEIEESIQHMTQKSNKGHKIKLGDAPVVLMPKLKPQETQQQDADTIQVITLNSEADYPGGSWLGNEKNPEARVRVPITPSQLLHINTLCTTPEKMAIVLLDYLFNQETQATSNLSGKGKHFKKQLDPLKIYGIKAHLMHKFNITERDWYRIKQNIDSKCRTAWRKKSMGLPLSRNKVKVESEKPAEKILSNSIVLAGPFISEDNSQELSSMIIEDNYTLTGCCEQTLTIITDKDEVNVPLYVSAEDSLSDEHSATEDIMINLPS